MKMAVGIDMVAVERFAKYSTCEMAQLQRLFSREEIMYALSNPLKSAERFAVRFAAKEAFLKAYAQTLPNTALSLLTIASAVSIHKMNGVPLLDVDWTTLKNIYSKTVVYNTSVSLTHTNCHATAVVVLYKVG